MDFQIQMTAYATVRQFPVTAFGLEYVRQLSHSNKMLRMYDMFAYIWRCFLVNMEINIPYTIHGSYIYIFLGLNHVGFCCFSSSQVFCMAKKATLWHMTHRILTIRRCLEFLGKHIYITKHFRYLKWRYSPICGIMWCYGYGLCKGVYPPQNSPT